MAESSDGRTSFQTYTSPARSKNGYFSIVEVATPRKNAAALGKREYAKGVSVGSFLLY